VHACARARHLSPPSRFSINAAVAKQANIGDGDGIEVMIGEGEPTTASSASARTRAPPTPRPRSSTTGKGAFFLIKIGHQPAFVDRSEPSARGASGRSVEDGWLEIVLPKMGRRDGAQQKARRE
jgi:hypothetical protein